MCVYVYIYIYILYVFVDMCVCVCVCVCDVFKVYRILMRPVRRVERSSAILLYTSTLFIAQLLLRVMHIWLWLLH